MKIFQTDYWKDGWDDENVMQETADGTLKRRSDSCLLKPTAAACVR